MNAISPLHSFVSVANSVILLLFWTNAKKSCSYNGTDEQTSHPCGA